MDMRAWIFFVVVFGIGCAVASVFTLYALTAIGWSLSNRPSSWPTLDAVIGIAKVGFLPGLVAGLGIWLHDISVQRKHRIQEPKRSWRWWRSNHD
jgi:H+/Cl- antiporter ClcA